MGLIVAIIAVLLAYLATIVLINRLGRPVSGQLVIANNDHLPAAGPMLEVGSWNIGFAGLGATAAIDPRSAKFWRPESVDYVRQAADGIAKAIATDPPDVWMIQESAERGFLTRGVPVNAILAAELPNFSFVNWIDMRLNALLPSLSIANGIAQLARIKSRGCRAVEVTQDDIRFFFGLFKKYYGALASRFEIEGYDKDWLIYNLHLSAFDSDAAVRYVQVGEVLKEAQAQYDDGHYVVIGGDWNMMLPPDGPETARGATQSPFPRDLLPENWSLAFDPNAPSVRDTTTAFDPVRSSTATIDGFVHSPNVRCHEIATRRDDFALSDHHAIRARFEAVAA